MFVRSLASMATSALLLVWLFQAARGDDRLFRDRVAPLLRRHCLRCHQGPRAKGGLDLGSRKGLLAGADGTPVVIPGKPDESPLIDAVSGEQPEMPKNGKPLSAGEVATLRQWVSAGANWPDTVVLKEDPLDWWSLRPLTAPNVPQAPGRMTAWARTPIDAFLLDALSKVSMTPSPEAERRTLLRRLSYDLTGLPPTPLEVEAFVADRRPLAYERQVDRLLASPHYGERWTRHWLDVVHYGDTHGYDKDKPRPNAWPYRDYLIRGFNGDKPYGQFTTEQLAGDVLDPDGRDGIEATGFLSAGPWDFIGHAEVPETKIDGKIARNLDRDDMVTTTFNTFCSLTVQCARCHDHKFDPVKQEHYYSLQAVFAAIDRADREYDVDRAVARRRRELRAQLSTRPSVPASPLPLGEGSGGVPPSLELAKRALAAELATLPHPSTVYCGTVHTGTGSFRGTGAHGGRPREIHILLRGDVRKPGQLVGPGTAPIIRGVDWHFRLSHQASEGDRRLTLARWIVDRNNPLTWRSIVNRVWLYHFGRGIVESPSDFGRMGQLPTHPELLDWMAADFRDGGQSLKRLHRRIVTSAAYRQVSSGGSSHFSPLPLGKGSAVSGSLLPPGEGSGVRGFSSSHQNNDAANTLLWRMNRQRLDAESIRDTALMVAGMLQERLYGPPFRPFVLEKPEHSPHYEYDKADPNDSRTHRRSVYQFLVRSQPDPFLATLDCADPSQIVDKRDESTTALQALALLNNRFMVSAAEHMARRIKTADNDRDARIAAVLKLTLQRPPTRDEARDLAEFCRQFGLAETCRLVFNLNEFVFVD